MTLLKAEPIWLEPSPWSGNEFRLTIFLKPQTPIVAKPLEASGEAASIIYRTKEHIDTINTQNS